MKNYFLYCLILLGINDSYSQVLPVSRYHASKTGSLLIESSFVFSLRKVKSLYNGYALKVRRGTDNAHANVSFDASGIVSATSNVQITAAGTSGLAIGQSMSYSDFKGSQTVFVTTWYDQGALTYNAVQTAATSQPELVLNSAGASNTLPSIVFNGDNKQVLMVDQPMQKLLGADNSASFLLVAKPTQNYYQIGFGYSAGVDTGGWRWLVVLNWIDNNVYFDAAEYCCGGIRSANNAGNVSLYKQYSFVNGSNYKNIRINSTVMMTNNSLTTVSFTGGTFGIGNIGGSNPNKGFYGNVSEVILLPKDLSTNALTVLESDQIGFWEL